MDLTGAGVHRTDALLVTLAPCPLTKWIQDHILSAPVVGWTNKQHSIWLLIFSFLQTLAALSFSPHLRGYVVAHTHNGFSDRMSLLLVLLCGTPCSHICDRTWTTNKSLKWHMIRL